MHSSRSALSSAAEYRDEFVCGSGFSWVVSLQNMSKLHEINLPIPYPTNTCATTYCTKLVLEIDVTIDSYLTTFLEKLTVLYCKNVVPQYVLTFIYFSPVLCFTLVYNCSLRVRNKQICYVMLCCLWPWWVSPLIALHKVLRMTSYFLLMGPMAWALQVGGTSQYSKGRCYHGIFSNWLIRGGMGTASEWDCLVFILHIATHYKDEIITDQLGSSKKTAPWHGGEMDAWSRLHRACRVRTRGLGMGAKMRSTWEPTADTPRWTTNKLQPCNRLFPRKPQISPKMYTQKQKKLNQCNELLVFQHRPY